MAVVVPEVVDVEVDVASVAESAVVGLNVTLTELENSDTSVDVLVAAVVVVAVVVVVVVLAANCSKSKSSRLSGVISVKPFAPNDNFVSGIRKWFKMSRFSVSVGTGELEYGINELLSMTVGSRGILGLGTKILFRLKCLENEARSWELCCNG